ncbi:MAG TPA: hypothetical protein V6D19_17315 [Stenomitos sp.]
MQNLKPWTAPKLTTHGGVETITAQLIKPKKLGSSDDFGVPGISSP